MKTNFVGMKINFDKLKIERPTLYARITKEVNHEYAGELEFYPDALGEEIEAELKAWKAAPSVHEVGCSCEACFQKRVSEDNAREKERLAAKAAGARLLQYMQEQGLKDNEHNRSKWSEFEAKLPTDVTFTPQLIDQFITGWRSVLEWGAPPAPVAPAPAPVERVVTLSADGSQQKSLEETPSSRWTLPQLHDWDRRKRAQALGESETLPPLEFIRGGKVVTEPRLPLSTRVGPQHSREQIEDLNVRTARAAARYTGSHGSGGSSWFDSRRL